MCTNSPAKSNSLSGGAEGVGKLSWQTFNCIFDSNDDDDDNQEGVGKLSWKTGQTFNCIFDLNQINRQSSTFNLLLKKTFFNTIELIIRVRKPISASLINMITMNIVLMISF